MAEAAQKTRTERATFGEASEPELVAAARAGDLFAFEEIVRRYHRRVLGLANRMLGCPEAGRDAAQEIFVTAFRSIGSVDPECELAPWLFTVAHNKLRDLLRRQKVRVKAGVETTDGSQELGDGSAPTASGPGHAPAADAIAERTEAMAHLEASVAALPAHYREVVLLHHLEMLPVREIAAIVGRPQGTVMTWLHRARAELRSSLEERGVAP